MNILHSIKQVCSVDLKQDEPNFGFLLLRQCFLPLSQLPFLCDALQVPVEQYLSFFIERSGKDAVSYLLELTCGLHSQTFGEDQILSQVKDALSTARINGTTNTVLKYCFALQSLRQKEVKTKVRLTTADHTVALGAVALLKDKLHVPMQMVKWDAWLSRHCKRRLQSNYDTSQSSQSRICDSRQLPRTEL